MTVITPELSLDPDQRAAGDVTHFWRVSRLRGLGCLRATFRRHSYASHTHETFAIAAIPMTDTVKSVAPDGRVLRTLDRSTLWAVQTPQVFRADILRRALERDAAALAAATDDAWLVDDAGGVITVVESYPENLKVTRESDLRIAEALLAH